MPFLKSFSIIKRVNILVDEFESKWTCARNRNRNLLIFNKEYFLCAVCAPMEVNCHNAYIV